jgi:hypothetical protein
VLKLYPIVNDTKGILERILTPLELNEVVSTDSLKSCCDLEVSWCEWSSSIYPEVLLAYWEGLAYNRP